MVKALKLEWLKFKSYKPFAIILGLFVLAYFAIGLSVHSFLEWVISSTGDQFEFFFEAGLPVLDFVDIWQNLAYITFPFKTILAFVVIISVCLEYSNRTIRQNFIDGLARREFLMSKIGLILFLSILSGAMMFVLGLILGLLYSPVKSLPFIFLNSEFVLAHMFEVFSYLSFALLIAALIRRTGFAIVLFVLYTLLIEPIGAAVMEYEYEIPNWYLPVRAINNIVHVPFPKYIFKEIQDYIALKDIAVALVWTAIFLWSTYALIKRRDT